MSAEGEIFNLSGPLHITTIDWQNPHHRRSIAASLVNGVYVQERDRQQKYKGPQVFGPPWWTHFHFDLHRVLIDDADISIFGAIYEFKYHAYHCNDAGRKPPRYVIAFRGTLTGPETRSQDLKLDLSCIFNKLHRSPRFHVAIQAVQQMMCVAGAHDVWLAGHSLGASVAQLVGRHMVKMGYHLETYLFNPPFICAPIGKIKNETIQDGIRITNSLIKAGLAAAINSHHPNNERNDSFSSLSVWIPYIFAHPSDPICSEYIGYYEHREKMHKMGAGAIERLSTQNSYGSLLSGALGKDSEPMHLIPTAYLTVNLVPAKDFRVSHGVEQWWVPNLMCQAKLHQFK